MSKKKKPIKPALSYNQMERQLKTWRREDRGIYNQIVALGQMFGAITKTGKVSRNKRNIKYYNQFIQVYQQQIGSFTSFQKKYKQANVKFKKPAGMTNKQYQKKAFEMETSLKEFFEEVYNIEDRDVAIELYDIASVMDIEQANTYMKEQLKKYHNMIDDESRVDSIGI